MHLENNSGGKVGQELFVKGANVSWNMHDGNVTGSGMINKEPYMNNKGVEVVDVFVDADSDSVEVPVEYLISK